ncbi:SDR family NAD(P)-dependent oxidoreductase [Pseudonocardia yunnanensis]|uniref:SDR family NAD(P)-dependent oxidoreductase n=1 Tax=Pseudonocardia yunnanensis TaxID=58107 RepID=A0ABW4EN08_9PSEU
MTSISNTPRTWFLTGASRGLGAIWARAIVERGDNLVATARDVDSLRPLAEAHGDRVLPLALDVTDTTAVGAAVTRAEDRFGGIDVLVNNAGHMLRGALEEATDAQVREQMEVNYFGALWTTRAVLPRMRARGHGHIMQVTSLGGVVAYPALGLYHASKWALEAVSESLAGEVAPFGIHVTMIEPIMFSTGLTAQSPQTTPHPAYGHARELLYSEAAAHNLELGRTESTGDALLALADLAEPPLRVLFGIKGVEAIRGEYDKRLATWEAGQDLSRLAHGVRAGIA